MNEIEHERIAEAFGQAARRKAESLRAVKKAAERAQINLEDQQMEESTQGRASYEDRNGTVHPG